MSGKNKYLLFVICYTLFVFLPAFIIDTPDRGYVLILNAKSSFEDLDVNERYYVTYPKFENIWKKVDGVEEIIIFHDSKVFGEPSYISRIKFESCAWELDATDELENEQLNYINSKIKQLGNLYWNYERTISALKIFVWVILLLIYKKIEDKTKLE